VKDEQFIILNHQLDQFDENISMNEHFKMKLNFTKSNHRQISFLLNYEKNFYLHLNYSKVFKNENHFKFKLNHVKSLAHRSNFLKISNEIQEFNQKNLKRKNEFEQEMNKKKKIQKEGECNTNAVSTRMVESIASDFSLIISRMAPPPPPPPPPPPMMIPPPPSNVPKLNLNEKVIKKIHWKPIKNISESVIHFFILMIDLVWDLKRECSKD
jgi:hypothetical protein